MEVQRGEIWWVDWPGIDGGLSGEKIRPALVVSCSHTNEAGRRVQVVPLSSQLRKIYECETTVRTQNAVSKTMADQLLTIGQGYLRNYITKVTSEEMMRVEDTLRYQLGL